MSSLDEFDSIPPPPPPPRQPSSHDDLNSINININSTAAIIPLEFEDSSFAPTSSASTSTSAVPLSSLLAKTDSSSTLSSSSSSASKFTSDAPQPPVQFALESQYQPRARPPPIAPLSAPPPPSNDLPPHLRPNQSQLYNPDNTDDQPNANLNSNANSSSNLSSSRLLSSSARASMLEKENRTEAENENNNESENENDGGTESHESSLRIGMGNELSSIQSSRIAVESGGNSNHKEYDDDEDHDADENIPSSADLIVIVHSWLSRIGWISLVSCALHITVSFLLLKMGYSRLTSDGGYSVTVVVCGFGCLNTCVFVIVSTYQAFEAATKPKLPLWSWFNRLLITSIIQCFFLIWFLFPGFVVFLIHSKQDSIFSILKELKTPLNLHNPPIIEYHSSIETPVALHFTVSLLVFLLDLATIQVVNRKLELLQQPRRLEEERLENGTSQSQDAAKSFNALLGPAAGREDGAEKPRPGLGKRSSLFMPFGKSAAVPISSSGAGTSGTGGDTRGDAEISSVPVTLIIDVQRQEQIFMLGTLILHTLFGVDLWYLSAYTRNSGPIASAVLYTIMWVGWIVKNPFAAKQLSEPWLVNFRLITAFHLIASYCFFWISLGILLTLTFYNQSFSSLLSSLPSGTEAICLITIICFPLVCISYAAILYYLTISVWMLDDITAMANVERMESQRERLKQKQKHKQKHLEGKKTANKKK